jgi:xanthine/uracil permease
VIGGLAIVLFGLIAATAGRIWVQNRVDFSQGRNLVTTAVVLTLGAGNLVLNIGNFALGGIGTAAFGAIIIYQLLREREPQPEEAVAADAAVGEPEQEPEPEPGAGE